jgi:hypothetical protein
MALDQYINFFKHDREQLCCVIIGSQTAAPAVSGQTAFFAAAALGQVYTGYIIFARYAYPPIKTLKHFKGQITFPITLRQE